MKDRALAVAGVGLLIAASAMAWVFGVDIWAEDDREGY